MTARLVLEALDNAVVAQQPEPDLILHTDLGTQYTSEVFQKQLQLYEITPSYSRKGCRYDNACIESFHTTLKAGTIASESTAVLGILRPMLLKKSVVPQRKQGIWNNPFRMSPQEKT